MGCGGSERERKGVEKRRTVFYQCLFSVLSVFYCKHASDWCPLLVAGLKEAKIDIGSASIVPERDSLCCGEERVSVSTKFWDDESSRFHEDSGRHSCPSLVLKREIYWFSL
jgi:hypothetical protein